MTPEQAGCFTAWHIIGYEACRLAYNQLVARRLLVIQECWLEALTKLIWEYSITPGNNRVINPWFLGGVDEALDHAKLLSAEPVASLLDSYATTELNIQAYDYQGHCAYCGTRFPLETYQPHTGQSFVVQDLVQEHAFCTRSCAIQHRAALFASVPELVLLTAPTAIYTALPILPSQLRAALERVPLPDLHNIHNIPWNNYQPRKPSFIHRLVSAT